MKNSMFRRVALVAPFFVLSGCAVEPLETESAEVGDSEATRESRQALGSTNQTVTDISTWNGLVAMVSGGNYRLTADIDAAGKTWTPKTFTGTFDGDDKRIYNLTISSAGDAGFFRTLNQAIVKNLRLTNLQVTGTGMVGGLAGISQDSQVERVSIEGSITASRSTAIGGIFGKMIGGSLYRSYAQGTVQSSVTTYSGGLTGLATASSAALATISHCYAQVTVDGDTFHPSQIAYAGGIAGQAYGADIHDVIAVGNVTGRRTVGGLVGYLNCQGDTWRLYKGIYRGDVMDRNAPGGWAGTVGGYGYCNSRFSNLFWDRDLDPSTNWLSNPEADIAQRRGTTTELRNPTTLTGGIYCAGSNDPPRCGDNNFQASDWEAGTASQHHMLKDMPGPNILPR